MTTELQRNRAIRAARAFLEAHGLLEVRTAKCVHAGAMEPYIDTFALQSITAGHAGYLASSPEFAMKKILAAEMQQASAAGGIYEIAAVFRDDRAGALHQQEFTMVEWYLCNPNREAIVTMAAQLIRHVAEATGHAMAMPAVASVDLRDVLAAHGLRLPIETESPYSLLYGARFKAMPHHVNELDREIACFNLLFDEIVLPAIRQIPGLVALQGFPVCIAALARCEAGTAARTELYVSGIELANAYSEEFDADIIRRRWIAYNEIRRLRAVPEHPIDEELLQASAAMRGVCGIALGLERLLLVLPRLRMQGHSPRNDQPRDART